MQSPKIVVIGAGSYFFGRPAIWNMVTSDVLKGGTLALVDTSSEVLATMMGIARRAIDHAGTNTALEGSTDRRDVLADADFVLLSFSNRNAHYRGVDCDISAKHGVRMCSGDTIGPGGVFRALREVPKALAMAKDVEELAPDAWVINFVNPTTVLGMALARYSSVKSFALCDGQHEPHNRVRILKAVGLLPDDARVIPADVEQKLTLHIVGVNHFSWMTTFEYDRTDMMPKWRELIAAQSEEELSQAKHGGRTSDDNAYSKAKFNSTYALKLMDVFGAYPRQIGHTKEYVPYFQGYGAAPVEPEPITVFDAAERQAKMDEFMRINRAYATGDRSIEEFFANGKGDHATDIIESMWGGLGKAFYVNTANRGAVSNMADDAFLELRSHLDMNGPVPLPAGEMPRGLLGLEQQVLDTHELTAEAAATCDRGILLRALATDPIVNNLVDAEALMEDLLEAEREELPAGWYG